MDSQHISRTAKTKKLKPLRFGVHAARGNTTVCGEFNFVADPEAAYIVLDRYTCPTYIATWEFSCRNSLPWVRIGGGGVSGDLQRWSS